MNTFLKATFHCHSRVRTISKFHIIRECMRQSRISGNNSVSSTFYSTVTIVKENQSKSLIIEKGLQSLKYHYFWLRDHCRCSNCYNRITAQRKVNILEIPDDIKPDIVYVDSSDVLTIVWEDRHKSEYPLSWLEECIYENYKKNLRRNHILWTKDEAKGAPIARVDVKELLVSNECLSRVMTSLVRYGVAFVDDVESIQETEEFSKRIGPVKNTLFGQMWEFADSMDHSDTAYTREALEPHTDNSYFTEASGLLVLHCLSHDGTGGENTLVDGFKAVEVLKERFPDVFDRLKSTSVGAEYLEKGQHHLLHAPVIQLNPLTEDTQQIRFNEYDRAPLILPYEKIIQHYQDLATFTKIIKNPEMIWKFKLNPGNALIIDNFRLLHGRTAYTGRRKMCGCYIGRTDFLSKTMHFANDM